MVSGEKSSPCVSDQPDRQGYLRAPRNRGGIAAYFVSQQFLLSLILAVTRDELIEDPGVVVVRYLLQTAHDFSLSTQYFTSIWVCTHIGH